jgi:hypothetical protein
MSPQAHAVVADGDVSVPIGQAFDAASTTILCVGKGGLAAVVEVPVAISHSLVAGNGALTLFASRRRKGLLRTGIVTVAAMLGVGGHIHAAIAASLQGKPTRGRDTLESLRRRPRAEVRFRRAARVAVGTMGGLGQQTFTAVSFVAVTIGPGWVAGETAFAPVADRRGVGATKAAGLFTAAAIEDVRVQRHFAAVLYPLVAVVVSLLAGTDGALAVAASLAGMVELTQSPTTTAVG